jgi:hypothetical protein
MKKDKLEGHVYSLSHAGMTRKEFDEGLDDLLRTFLIVADEEFVKQGHFVATDFYSAPTWRVSPSRRDRFLEVRV